MSPLIRCGRTAGTRRYRTLVGPARSGHGVEQRLCFLQPILVLRRRIGAGRHCCRLVGLDVKFHRRQAQLHPYLADDASCGLANGNLVDISPSGRGEHSAPIRSPALCVCSRILMATSLSVSPCPARTCRTGPRRRCRNNLSGYGPSRSCTRHRGYSPRRPAPAAGHPP